MKNTKTSLCRWASSQSTACNTVTSPRGVLVGSAPLQTVLQAPLIKIGNTINQWSFVNFHKCQAAPLHKRKAPCCRLSCDGSAAITVRPLLPRGSAKIATSAKTTCTTPSGSTWYGTTDGRAFIATTSRAERRARPPRSASLPAPAQRATSPRSSTPPGPARVTPTSSFTILFGR